MTGRIALYSHDSTGLGHVRRNLRLAAALRADGHDVLLLSGSPESTAMPRPPGTDLITLPALAKDGDGTYRARHLGLELSELRRLRRDLLTTALVGFAPDLLVVDRHARGFAGELEPALDALPTSRVVLGLRDVLDSPEVVRAEWDRDGTAAALARWYDEVWLYGDPATCDPLATAGVEVPVPVRATGYLVVGDGDTTRPVTDDPFVLGTVGGGADGAQVAAATLRAPLPPGHRLILATGPQMPRRDRDALRVLATSRPAVRVVDYLPDAGAVLRRARAAVVMGGYNTVAEALGSTTPVLVVPRERPRREQALRARALAEVGAVDTASLAHLRPEVLGRWLAEAVRRPRVPREGLDLDGLTVVRERVARLLAGGPPRTDRAAVVADGHATSPAGARADHVRTPTPLPTSRPAPTAAPRRAGATRVAV